MSKKSLGKFTINAIYDLMHELAYIDYESNTPLSDNETLTFSIRELDPLHRKRLPDILTFHLRKPRGSDMEKIIDVTRTDASDEQISVLLAALPPSLVSFREAIRTHLRLPELTALHFAQAEEKLTADRNHWENAQKITTQIAQLPVPASTDLPLTNQNTLYVYQRGGKIINRQDIEPKYLVTSGVAHCVALILKSPKAIGLAHIDIKTNIDSISGLVNSVRSSPDMPVEAVLWGGRPGISEPMIANIVDFLEKQPNVRITHVDICAPAEKRPTSIAVSSTGQILITADERIKKMIGYGRRLELDDLPMSEFGKDALSPLRLQKEREEPIKYKKPPISPTPLGARHENSADRSI
jgi:hypothetical protein